MEENKDESDYLGYCVYADTLWARIESALKKDLAHREACLRANKTPPALGDDPLVVGIFGEWGAGKSTLLSLVQQRAEAQRDAQVKEHKLDGYQAITVPVFFQPWKYEHEKHLLVPLLLHILVELERTLALARNWEDKATGVARDVVKATKNVLANALKKVGDISEAVGLVMGVADPIASAPLATMGKMLAHGMSDMLAGKTKRKAARDYAPSENGRAYYEMHRILSEATRPAKNPHVTGEQHHDKDFCVNFVIFIDDLDRCLPEKAVEALELIKTVFNLESFAFVLALDEEVVERGIGHRYKDYALQNKKPEMPITGFEYLEKIVHLPFRLPALTRAQAERFLIRYESEEVAPNQSERWWFAPRPAEQDLTGDCQEDATTNQQREAEPQGDLQLTRLVLDAFTAYVPRKLVRVVELLHQTQEVTARRGKSFKGSGGADVRVVVALLLVQLFQPELYRIVRRKPQAFPLLLAAFATRSDGSRDFLDSELSDVDLWLWVTDDAPGEGNSWVSSADLSKAADAVVQRISALYQIRSDSRASSGISYEQINGETIRMVDVDNPGTHQQRARAQNVKLPLVAQLVEHRAAQRHVFDPLRLLHSLALALEEGWTGSASDAVSPAASLEIRRYFSLLASDETVSERSSPMGGRAVVLDARTIQPLRYPDRLFADLISEKTEVQTNLASNSELEPGSVIDDVSGKRLLAQVKAWLDEGNAVDGRLSRLSRGLRYVAAYIPRDQRNGWLELFPYSPDSARIRQSGARFESVEQMQIQDQWMEVRSALGLDDDPEEGRFDPRQFYLIRDRHTGHDEQIEPIPGFVRLPAVHYESEEVARTSIFERFPRREAQSGTCYLARTLTTVSQFLVFISEDGYQNKDWWDDEAWNLIRFSEAYDGARTLPAEWESQIVHPGRPVGGVSWHEARAYARWLTNRMEQATQKTKKLHWTRLFEQDFCFGLPTWEQWERAVRATGHATIDSREFPWGGDDVATAHLHANLRESQIGHATVPGLFAPNPLGIYDLCGNMVEWQSNSPPGDADRQPAIRSAPWSSRSERAGASHIESLARTRREESLGFRLALSVGEKSEK